MPIQRLWKILLTFCIFMVCFVYYDFTHNRDGIEKNKQKYIDHTLDRITRLMTQSSLGVIDPLNDVYIPEKNMLLFYHFPKLSRTSSSRFTEITTANRDATFPLSPDFSFFVDYGNKSLVMYEAYNPGCVVRIYLIPTIGLPLKGQNIQFDIDGKSYTYPVTQLHRSNQYPFFAPISLPHDRPDITGVSSFLPICYEKQMKITYLPNKQLPDNLLNRTIECSDYKRCIYKCYSGISMNSYPVGTKIKAFSPVKNSHLNKMNSQNLLKEYTNALKSAHMNGPDKGKPCILQCVTLCKGCTTTIFKNNNAKVITAMKFRVFKIINNEAVLVNNWNDILITMIFDDSNTAQVKQVPLGCLFTVIGSLDDLTAATMGVKVKHCSYESVDNINKIPRETHTGYFYFPMPYWKTVKVIIESAVEISNELVVCYQFNTFDNLYSKDITGYFYIEKTYYTGDVTGWRNVLSLDNVKGHIAAVFMDADNMKPSKTTYSDELYVSNELDQFIYIDKGKEASMMGTGFEDFFSFGHNFVSAENRSYSLVGNFQARNSIIDGKKKPEDRHCFRIHLFDPIPFQNSIQFVMEGADDRTFHQPIANITYQEYRQLVNNKEMALSHMVIYYGKHSSQFKLEDIIEIGNTTSEKSHSFAMEPISDNNRFEIVGKMFVGQVTNRIKYNRTGRAFFPGNKLSFKLKHSLQYKHFLLRREFYSPLGTWKQHAILWINNNNYGPWYIPMGATSENYSLREDDIIINSDLIKSSSGQNGIIDISISVETQWRDTAYHLYGFN